MLNALFWLAILVATAASLLLGLSAPEFDPGRMILSWALIAGCAICAFAGAEGAITRRHRYRLIWSAPSQLVDPPGARPSFDRSCLIVGMLAIAAFGYPLMIPEPLGETRYRLASLLSFATALAGAVGLWLRAKRRWHGPLADAGAALLTLALLHLSGSLVHTGDADHWAIVGRRLYAWLPMLGVLCLLWAWLRGVWTQQLDAGVPWTMTGRLHGRVVGIVLITGACGAGLGILLGLWPVLAPDSATGGSWLRNVAGILGYVLLLAAMVVCWRRWNRPVFGGLAVLVAAGFVIFLFMRLTGNAAD